MPRGVKNVVPEHTNEERDSDLGFMPIANRVTGKTQWMLERQLYGVISGKIYERVPLENHKDGKVLPVEYSSKANALAFIDGYNYRNSEIDEE